MNQSFQAITYKRVGDLEIKLDLYLPSKSNTSPLSILVWFHGGGLILGHRATVKPHMLAIPESGVALISADYRLAPQVTATDILDDVQDCLFFVHDKLQDFISASTRIKLDTTRICVSGSSAGGYLALLAGIYSDIPKVILAIYPITDPCGEFFTTSQPIPEGHIDRETVAPFLDKKGVAVACSERSSPRQNFYSYMLQEAILAELLSVTANDEEMIIRKAIKKKGSFPPTYIIHGDQDKSVAVEQSLEIIQALKEIGCTMEYEVLPGLDHLFDVDPKYQFEEMYKFMRKYLR
jgi:acetyl esterase/lipase